MTDPDNFTATAIYNYDMGVATQTQTPLPKVTTNQPGGPKASRLYDAAGRILRVTNSVNAALTKWVYSASMTLAETYASVDTGVEAHAFSVLDGAGRVRASARDLPGSTNGVYAGQLTDYDAMGRIARRSNPAATAATGGTWTTTGDDAPVNGGPGWLYTQTGYDWKGRPLLVTNTDGTTKEFLYGGCGCAGGQIVTTRDETGRRQRITYDVLGRAQKTQVLTQQASKPQPFTADPNEVAYSTTTNTLDALDRTTEARVRAESSGVEQVTTMSYDGYGRLQSSHAPEQNAGTATVYVYNADDSLQSVVDARGAMTSYSYNNSRRLVTGVSYSAPSGITVPSSVTFAYDSVGNRTEMTDGFGHVDYVYTALSQLQSEARTFNDPGNAAVNNLTKTISYSYTTGGALKSVTDPSGGQVTYGYDQAGQLNGMTGMNLGGQGGSSTLVPDIKYRAWGATKHLAYGNGVNLDFTYDARRRITQQKLAPTGTPTQGQVNRTHDYQYYDDGRVKFISDNFDHNFDRSYAYNDPTGRLTQALTGYQARGEQSGVLSPYKETFQYNEWGNMTDRFTRTWNYETGMRGNRVSGQWFPLGPVAYTNNRRSEWSYDADGRALLDGITHTFDAAGRQATATQGAQTATQSYDGDGRRVKRADAVTMGAVPNRTTTTTVVYEVRSSVLGAVVEELNGSGVKQLDYIYSRPGALLAKSGTNVVFVNYQAVTGSAQESNGTSPASVSRTELDPLGADVGLTMPEPVEEPDRDFPRVTAMLRNAASGCLMDGLPIPCTVAQEIDDFNQRAGSRSVRIRIDNSPNLADRLRGRVGPSLDVRRNSLGHQVSVDMSDGFIGAWFSGVGGAPSWRFTSGFSEAHASYSMYARSFGAAPQNPIPDTVLTKEQIKKLKGCLDKLFKVELNDLTYVQPGAEGTFTGTNKKTGEEYTVNTDVSTYTRADIKEKYGNWWNGYTDGTAPYTNYT